MKKITVKTSVSYDIIIQKGILVKSTEYIKSVTNAQKIAVITDDIVDKLYSNVLLSALNDAGYNTCKFVFPNGEKSKCLSTLNDIYMFLSENNITRSDCIVALGGGVVGDITGFAAATYLRGIDFIQIPTTLLAQVDSSVGGKTAIDIQCGKNLVGAFKQPILVLCDTDTLSSLPEEIIEDGMGEVVKYGMIKSTELFEILEKHNISNIFEILDDIIYRCISIKCGIVESDEFDKADRMILNFGHTLGHSIEKYYNFSGITHGKAVAKGMLLITKIAVNNKLSDNITYCRLFECLANYKLNNVSSPDIKLLADACLNDKKRDGNKINIIICNKIGNSQIVKMPVDRFMSFICN